MSSAVGPSASVSHPVTTLPLDEYVDMEIEPVSTDASCKQSA